VPNWGRNKVDKATEMEFIDRMINQLGPGSYLGPWLKEHRDEIFYAIAADIPVEMALKDTRTLEDGQ